VATSLNINNHWVLEENNYFALHILNLKKKKKINKLFKSLNVNLLNNDFFEKLFWLNYINSKWKSLSDKIWFSFKKILDNYFWKD
jgi:hypothetical protein